MILPTLRVGMHPSTLRVGFRVDAERPGRHPHAERGDDQISPKVLFARQRLRALMKGRTIRHYPERHEERPMWKKPAFTDLRIGFEVTMYFASR